MTHIYRQITINFLSHYLKFINRPLTLLLLDHPYFYIVDFPAIVFTDLFSEHNWGFITQLNYDSCFN